jgi:hypothetical protein
MDTPSIKALSSNTLRFQKSLVSQRMDRGWNYRLNWFLTLAVFFTTTALCETVYRHCMKKSNQSDCHFCYIIKTEKRIKHEYSHWIVLYIL